MSFDADVGLLVTRDGTWPSSTRFSGWGSTVLTVFVLGVWWWLIWSYFGVVVYFSPRKFAGGSAERRSGCPVSVGTRVGCGVRLGQACSRAELGEDD